MTAFCFLLQIGEATTRGALDPCALPYLKTGTSAGRRSKHRKIKFSRQRGEPWQTIFSSSYEQENSRKNSVVLAECAWKCVGNGRRLVKETTGFLLTRTVRECYRGRSFNSGEIA